jgi:hypothetical protein
MRSNGGSDNPHIPRPSSRVTQDEHFNDVFSVEGLFAYFQALKDARDRANAKAEDSAATAKVLNDRVTDFHNLIRQCSRDRCLLPERIEPISARLEERPREGGVR